MLIDVDEPRNEQEGDGATVADMGNHCYICILPRTHMRKKVLQVAHGCSSTLQNMYC